MCIHMCTHMRGWMWVRGHVYLCGSVSMKLYRYMHMCTCACIFMQGNVHAYQCFVFLCICMCICVYISTCAHMHIHRHQNCDAAQSRREREWNEGADRSEFESTLSPPPPYTICPIISYASGHDAGTTEACTSLPSGSTFRALGPPLLSGAISFAFLTLHLS